METKITTKKNAAKKDRVDTEPISAEPFAAAVESAPVKKRTVKPEARVPKRAAKPIAKKSVKEAGTLNVDPFAEVAKTPSPVKKTRVGAAKSEVKLPKKVAKAAIKAPTPDNPAGISAAKPEVEVSPSFRALSEPVLPQLQRANRARLQMQSPTKLYFYWSAKQNPWALLRDAFGGETGNYALVLKLTNLRRDTEEIHAAEAEGNCWFDVDPDGAYQAEIGFYAPNRPYFRVIYSNTVETPRRTPSPRSAQKSDWTVSANKFAEVLDVAGFTRDALDVAVAGDDNVAAQDVTQKAFTRFVGKADYQLDEISAEDIRYAMLSIASGVALEQLQSRVSTALYAILKANADNLESGKAMSALTEYFDIDETEFSEEQFGPAVFGTSLLNFPRTLKTRLVSSRYNPVSSRSFC